jgi:hypothetical protein
LIKYCRKEIREEITVKEEDEQQEKHDESNDGELF